MTKKSRQKLKYLDNEKRFFGEIKSIFHHFQRRLSVAKNRVRPVCAPLTIGNILDYKHEERVSKKCEILNLGDCHHLYIKSDTLLLADVFKNFKSKFLEIYELDPAHFMAGMPEEN